MFENLFKEVENPVWDIKDLKPLAKHEIKPYIAPYHLDTKIEETRINVENWINENEEVDVYVNIFDWINFDFKIPGLAPIGVVVFWGLFFAGLFSMALI